MMEKLTYREAVDYLKKFNKDNGITSVGSDKKAYIVIVISNSSFDQEYSLESRSYLVANDNKAFLPDMFGYSIFSDSLDGTDRGVRLDRYLEDEGNTGGWKVEYCYIYDK